MQFKVSCPLDCKILFNPWNNNFDWAGWTDKQNNLFL